MRTRTGGAVLLLVLTGATTAACGDGASPTPAPPSQTDVVIPFGHRVPALTNGEQSRLDRMERRLVDDCLADRGIDVEPLRLPSPPAAADETPAWNPYGLLTEDFAVKEGYGITGPVLRGEPSFGAEPARDAGEDEEAFEKALTGTEEHRKTVRLPTGESFTVNTDGCQFRAGEKLYGKDWDRLMYTYQFLANRVVEDVERTDEVKRARKRWAACMTDAGHPVSDGSAAELVGKRTDAAKARAGEGDGRALRSAAGYELAVARDDARCQRESELWEAVSAAQRTVERPMADKHRKQLAGYAGALERAKQRL
ncbi:hypothetical protein IQ279_23045 [Streptomyces verrucosisporus]|uniref:hypothetical protein n=1 Tax=Streptomyces verrucosisporus TaxID=1695161 RepID=UPI0019D24E64|nr:hypothetical protein [Streptomyces verrucosisporus]MBN3932458.1 hypothetical protein [Streptomyces verrucosisporus]